MPHQILDHEVYRLSIYATMQQQQSCNSIAFQIRNVVGGNLTDQDAVNLLNTALDPLFVAIISARATMDGYTLRRIYTPNVDSTPVTKFSLSGVAGAVAGDPLPKQVAGLISFYSEVAGRRGRGRMFLPFPAESQNDATSAPTAGYVADVDVIATYFSQSHTLTVGANTVDVYFGNWIGGDNVNIYTTHRTHDLWASQRRRGSFGQTYPNPFQ